MRDAALTIRDLRTDTAMASRAGSSGSGGGFVTGGPRDGRSFQRLQCRIPPAAGSITASSSLPRLLLSHCHGTEYRRPFASQQIYTGDLFEQIGEARDFVLRKIERAIGTRQAGPTAPAAYELPPDVIAEAIVNAVAHRDYNSNASVEVRLFADRLEVWNPGSQNGTEIGRLRHPLRDGPTSSLVRLRAF